jgi:hypothetical protein
MVKNRQTSGHRWSVAKGDREEKERDKPKSRDKLPCMHVSVD